MTALALAASLLLGQTFTGTDSTGAVIKGSITNASGSLIPAGPVFTLATGATSTPKKNPSLVIDPVSTGTVKNCVLTVMLQVPTQSGSLTSSSAGKNAGLISLTCVPVTPNPGLLKETWEAGMSSAATSGGPVGSYTVTWAPGPGPMRVTGTLTATLDNVSCPKVGSCKLLPRKMTVAFPFS